MKLQDFMSFLHENKMIDLNHLLSEDEIGCINRLKLQKYVYLAQTCLKYDFGYEYNIYNNGPYSPDLANYYYEKLNLEKISFHKADDVQNHEKRFFDMFLELFEGKEPEWLEVAATLIDVTNYSENEQECLNRVYTMKSKYIARFIDNAWNELKDKNLVNYKHGPKLNNFLSVF